MNDESVTGEDDLSLTSQELISKWKPQAQFWQVLIQMNQIQMDPEYLSSKKGFILNPAEDPSLCRLWD